MVIGHVIVKKYDVIDALPVKPPGNNIPEGTVWLNKLQKFNNGLRHVPGLGDKFCNRSWYSISSLHRKF